MEKLIKIKMDEDIFLGMNKHPNELASDMRLAAAVKWYELRLITQSMAARVAGLSRAEFIDSLSRFSVSPFQETAEEIISAVHENESGI
jgi:hypothetical protein